MERNHTHSRSAAIVVPVVVAVIGAGAAVAAALLGNSGTFVNVLPGNPTTTSLVTPPPATVTATVTVTARPSVSSTPTSTSASTSTQLLGSDIELRSSDGNQWRVDGPGNINGESFDDVVAMGWCDGCLDSFTTSGYAEFNLDGRSQGHFKATLGQLDTSADSSGQYRFDVLFDDVKVFSQVIAFGESIPVDLALNGTLRIRLEVTLQGDAVNAVTAFGNARVEG